MVWRISIHKLVLSEDFVDIPSVEQTKILKAIQKRLAVDPEAYGKPLTDDYKGLWRLRMGNYRVVYRIVKEEVVVFVVKVGIRKDDQVYEELMKRLRKM